MRKIRRWGPGLLLVSPSIVLDRRLRLRPHRLERQGLALRLAAGRGDVRLRHERLQGAVPVRRRRVGEFVARRDGRAVGHPEHRSGLDHRPAPRRCSSRSRSSSGTLIIGATLAFLLDKGVKGEGFFRTIYLFPMAVSFIAAGVVWRWLMNPAPGRPRRPGFNLVFDKLGLGFLAQRVVPRPGLGHGGARDTRRSGRSPATSWRCTSPASAACPRSCARRRAWTARPSGASTATSSSRTCGR